MTNSKEPPNQHLYKPAFEAAFRILATTLDQVAACHDTADVMSALLSLPPSRRLPAIDQRELPLHPGLTGCLLARGRMALEESPADAEHLGRLALMVAERLDGSQCPVVLVMDHQTEAWALITLAQLAQGQLAGARISLMVAESLIGLGSGDPLTFATVFTSRAAVAQADGEVEEALGCLDAVVTIATSVDDDPLVASALVQRGLLYRANQDLEKARRDLSAGLLLLNRSCEPNLAARVQSILAELAPDMPCARHDPSSSLTN